MKCNRRDTLAAMPAMGTMGDWPQEQSNLVQVLGSQVLLCSNQVHSRVTCKHLFSAHPCACPSAGIERLQTINQLNLSQKQNFAAGKSHLLGPQCAHSADWYHSWESPYCHTQGSAQDSVLWFSQSGRCWTSARLPTFSFWLQRGIPCFLK